MSNPIQKTTLYRYFDSNHSLLYVGITKDPYARAEFHSTKQPWWEEVSYGTFMHFDSRQEALEAEDFIIGSQFPKYNKAGPVLEFQARKHLAEIMANDLEDDEHRKQSLSIAETMSQLEAFSKKPEAHKLLFAFGESFAWDDEGWERLVFCTRCQEILDSSWFKKLYEQVHLEVCDESAIGARS